MAATPLVDFSLILVLADLLLVPLKGILHSTPPSDDGGVAASVNCCSGPTTAGRLRRLHSGGAQMGLEPVHRDSFLLVSNLQLENLRASLQHQIGTSILRGQRAGGR